MSRTLSMSQRILLVATLVLIPGVVLAQDAAAVLKRVSDAMGAGEVKSIRYADEGTGYTFGQAYKPGMPWPKITVHSQVRIINYETGSMRDEITLRCRRCSI